jgi:glycosyltransferase involved in cell wall biosynthesis
MFKKNVSIIIPVKNEKKNILNTIRSIKKNSRFSFKILICYDSVSDNTLRFLNNSNLKNKYFLCKNKASGPHGAVISGIKSFKSDYYYILPADDEINAKKLPLLINLMVNKNIDILCLCRLMKGGAMINAPFIKLNIMKLVNYFLYYICGLPSKDSTNGSRIFSHGVVSNIKINSRLGFSYSLEYLIKAYYKGYKILDYPSIWKERNIGNSNFKLLKWSKDYCFLCLYAFYLNIKKIFIYGPDKSL